MDASAFPLHNGTPEQFAECRRLFEQAGYTEQGLCERLEIASPGDYRSIRQGRTTAVEIEQPVDVIIRLFMDGEYVSGETIASLLGACAIETLSALALILADGGRHYSPVVLYPVGSLYLASDRASNPDGSPFYLPVDVVYPALVENTRRFLSMLPDSPCEAFLDIGTGSGVAAMLAASRYAKSAWGVDITERAIRYAEFNRLLSGLENASMSQGDLYGSVVGLTFDRIVAHPPYVPVLKPTYVFRDGGEDGEQILRRIVEGLPRYLRAGGRFYCQTLGSDREGEPFEQRIRKWLGDAQADFDVILAADSTRDPMEFAVQSAQNSNSTAAELQHWKALFEKLQIRYLFYGSVLIHRKDEARNAVTLRAQKGERTGPAEVDWLLAWGAAGTNPETSRMLLDSAPVISPQLKLNVAHQVSEGQFVPSTHTLQAEYPFSTECRCAPWIAHLISRCDGAVTGHAHFESLKAGGALHPETSAEEFVELLGSMILAGFLEIEPFLPPISRYSK